ncbi:GNAT family N-acetyltransferase [Parabacteroides sp. ZJ-118]|uniref:lipid II:glycine glycyltransferase FemX n=1 Tax=Parabacteroides sp. ZJ-118 TaxID=2709398 RepID=UPI0013EC1903|nr:GNAT family N-acetyltransferase [Parabacteroides sp. ZJ-118]
MVKLLTIGDSLGWDEIVKSFPNYDVYYLSGYVKAFKIHGDGNPALFYYSDDTGGRAICVLMLRDVAKDSLFKDTIPENTYFDAVTPYGYGGFIFDGEVDTKNLANEFRQSLKELHVNSVFFRFHPVLDNAKDCGDIVTIIPLGKTITLDLTSPDIIWENIISKNRNMIRKAERSGVEIYHSSDPKLFSSFKEIYDATMRGDNAEEYYFFEDKFYESIAHDLARNYEIFYATHEDKIISIAIMIFANNQMHYHLSGSLREYRSLAPSNLLLYKAALWGYEQGFKTFHLGGGVGSGEDPLYKFKAAFNRNSDCRFSIGKSIIDNEDYEYLSGVRGFSADEAASISYFPQYRGNK